jgi:hypothetical protein
LRVSIHPTNGANEICNFRPGGFWLKPLKHKAPET